eukprot:NODE_289_length_1711_cov_94.194444_g260_i0.p1 GENE.NODE_289_length_1711_cov_94.194444_g260_i0~~NODE_289_length_1711_cov_94.194444_g260_i0.p1  ORF type:complete len:552 (-),score=100.04 NODE_289_length_1711_cov_94.194444_g260_i0:55-1638(-)
MQDHKSKKYDRQLRLWGEHGQEALETAKICLIGASAVGCETLKNCVLPGFGSFTVVDGKTVTEADIGNNFFLTKSSIGNSRAKCCTELLKEMNPDVDGSFVEEDPAQLISNNLKFFAAFTLVIVSELTTQPLHSLCDFLWQREIPVLVLNLNGFLASLRLSTPTHTVVETHPDNPIVDLRLDNPLPELVQLVASTDLMGMSSKDYAHVPFVVLLLFHMDLWKQNHDGKLPQNTAEKDAFKQQIRNYRKQTSLSVSENIDEAVSNAHRAWGTTTIPSNTRTVFADELCTNLTKKSSNFWIVARAIKEYTENEGNGYLPLTGALPDMHSNTEFYVQLQKLYHAKAQADIAAVNNRVASLLQSLELGSDTVPAEEIARMCRHSHELSVIHFSSLQQELDPSSAQANLIGNSLGDPTDNIAFYVLFQAASIFQEQHKRYPGTHDDEVEEDAMLLKKCAGTFLSSIGATGSVSDEFCLEFCRYGGCQPHNISSLMGGVASQEVIKLVTGQFEPLNNTFIFNGTNSTAAVYNL